MSNCYDINIKMNYFMSGDDYEMMLENKKRWEEEVGFHNKYFEKISTEEKYQEAWDEIYGESKENKQCT